uniref:Putative secreted protein n=1 Tax=Panstrongylus lignarius TaxID=156445 RepID=A0A224Y6V6_9HEMI
MYVCRWLFTNHCSLKYIVFLVVPLISFYHLTETHLHKKYTYNERYSETLLTDVDPSYPTHFIIVFNIP